MKASDDKKPLESKAPPKKTELALFKMRIDEVFDSEVKFETDMRTFLQTVKNANIENKISQENKIQLQAMLIPIQAYVNLAQNEEKNQFIHFKPDPNDDFQTCFRKLEIAMNSEELKARREILSEATAAYDVTNVFLADLKKSKDPDLQKFSYNAAFEVIKPVQRNAKYTVMLLDIEKNLSSYLQKESKLEEPEAKNYQTRLSQLQESNMQYTLQLNKKMKEMDQQRESLTKLREDYAKNASLIHEIRDTLKTKQTALEKDLKSFRAFASENFKDKTKEKLEALNTLIEGLELSGSQLPIARKYLELAKQNEALSASRGITASGMENTLSNALQKIDALDSSAKIKMPTSTENIQGFHLSEVQKLREKSLSFGNEAEIKNSDISLSNRNSSSLLNDENSRRLSSADLLKSLSQHSRPGHLASVKEENPFDDPDAHLYTKAPNLAFKTEVVIKGARMTNDPTRTSEKNLEEVQEENNTIHSIKVRNGS